MVLDEKSSMLGLNWRIEISGVPSRCSYSFLSTLSAWHVGTHLSLAPRMVKACKEQPNILNQASTNFGYDSSHNLSTLVFLHHTFYYFFTFLYWDGEKWCIRIQTSPYYNCLRSESSRLNFGFIAFINLLKVSKKLLQDPCMIQLIISY